MVGPLRYQRRRWPLLSGLEELTRRLPIIAGWKPRRRIDCADGMHGMRTLSRPPFRSLRHRVLLMHLRRYCSESTAVVVKVNIRVIR